MPSLSWIMSLTILMVMEGSTLSAMILRDLDLLSELAREGLCQVMVSVTTLNETLRRQLEPRASTGAGRLKVIEKLASAGVQVGVLAAPMIPRLNEPEMEQIIKSAAEAGAVGGGAGAAQDCGTADGAGGLARPPDASRIRCRISCWVAAGRLGTGRPPGRVGGRGGGASIGPDGAWAPAGAGRQASASAATIARSAQSGL